MSGWNFDIKSAPHGRYEVKQRREGVDVRVFVPEKVILATKCRKVLQSYYVPDEKRWMFLHHGEQPVAWMPWPEYPHSLGRAEGDGHDSTVGPAPSEQVGAPNLSGSAARGQAALSGECPEAPPVDESSQEATGNSGNHLDSPSVEVEGMTVTPNYSLSAVDRLWLVLEAHEGNWTSVQDPMFEAGFVPTQSNPLTPYTSFYFNLCKIEDACRGSEYQIGRQGGYVAMCRRAAA